jgi:hypothetical protein
MNDIFNDIETTISTIRLMLRETMEIIKDSETKTDSDTESNIFSIIMKEFLEILTLLIVSHHYKFSICFRND